jgi:DNA helicase HerA-like ATPase
MAGGAAPQQREEIAVGQLMRGARDAVDLLLSDLKEIATTADLDRKAVIFDPVGAANALEDIRDQIEAVRRRVLDEITPLLERAERNREAAGLPDKVAELERRLEALEKAQGKVVQLRREA